PRAPASCALRPTRECPRSRSRGHDTRGTVMCGISGELRFDGRSPDLRAVERINSAQARRGPDGDGRWADDRAALAHRRLAIIDLSDRGRQPMVDEDLDLVVVFNGCIYNHVELRRELEAAGHRFASQSD